MVQKESIREDETPTIESFTGVTQSNQAEAVSAPSFHATLTRGSCPQLGRETQRLLQTRLTYAAAFLTAALLLSGILRGLVEPQAGFRIKLDLLLVLLIAGDAAITAFLFLRKDIPVRVLRVLEFLLIVPSALYVAGAQYLLTANLIGTEGQGILAARFTKILAPFTFLIFFYAMFIPNTWRRAAAVIVPIALLPILVRGLLRFQYTEVQSILTLDEAVWSLSILSMTACAAIIGTHVINTLRLEAFKARELGQYRLVEKIGEGGMGEVWKASHRMLARPAAVKLILPEMLGTQSAGMARALLQRFEREAQATAMLTSPHSIALYDFGITDSGTFYYVMELLDGMDLETLVRSYGPPPAGRIIHLLVQTCEALADAHSRNLIHRDIKPANIFVCRMGREFDFVKVLDFGLVKSLGGDAGQEPMVTQAGTIAGTPAFMSPEQALGNAVDGRSDLYSLGCVAYFLLTGQMVFPEVSPVSMLIEHVKTPPQPPSDRMGKPVAEDLERVILRCLEKDPSRRFTSAEELIDELALCADCGSWGRGDASRWWLSDRAAGQNLDDSDQGTLI